MRNKTISVRLTWFCCISILSASQKLLREHKDTSFFILGFRSVALSAGVQLCQGIETTTLLLVAER